MNAKNATTRPRSSTIAEDVRAGLSAGAKSLPPYLFYDDEGSRLYELITALPEYYPSRTERAILERRAPDIVQRVLRGASSTLRVVELGAGTAEKTCVVLSAVVDRQGPCIYVPVDVSASALDEAVTRISAALPTVDVRPLVGSHEDAFEAIGKLGPRRLVLFIGSSIGNFTDDEAIRLLAGVRRGLAPGGALLLGTDLRKSTNVLLPAYDDAAGITAAFNKNILARINRELGATFNLDRFEHVALWNDEASQIEMHLESTVDQDARIGALDLTVHFRAGERIHTESSIKYDLARVDALVERAGFWRECTYTDDAGLFAVHLARVGEHGG